MYVSQELPVGPGKRQKPRQAQSGFPNTEQSEISAHVLKDRWQHCYWPQVLVKLKQACETWYKCLRKVGQEHINELKMVLMTQIPPNEQESSMLQSLHGTFLNNVHLTDCDTENVSNAPGYFKL